MSTSWLMPEDLREAGAATEQGLEFLKRNVEADGAWPCRRYTNWELTGSWSVEFPPFLAGLGMLALEGCAHPAAEELRARTRAFLHTRIEYPGVWRYWPHLVPDLDSTAICSLAATPHLWLLLARNVDAILSWRDGEGRFRTWMYAQDDADAARTNEVDCVVNANVIAYLGDREETRAAQRWLEALVEEPRVTDALLPFYPGVMDFYVACARASCLAPVFAGLRPTLASRILACRDAGGGFGDVLRTAQAMTALDRLGEGGREAVVRPALESILATQRPDGGWPECFAWKGLPGTSLGFGPEAWTTACCIEAMVRAVRQ